MRGEGKYLALIIAKLEAVFPSKRAIDSTHIFVFG